MGAIRARLLVTGLLVAVGCAGAFGAQVSFARDVTYKITFTGKGSFTSKDVEAVEGAGDCANATDTVTEKSSFTWRTNYTLTIPRSGERVVKVDGDNIDQPGTKWLQTSDVLPPDCFGGSQDCTGVLFPASPRHPAQPGDKRQPELVAAAKQGDMYIDSVVDLVVGPNVGGPSACQTYARYHTALQPFSLAHRIPPYRNLSVQNAMEAYVPLERQKMNKGKEFSVEVKQPKSDQPPANCKPFSFDAITCTEQLTWSGEVTFRPA